VTLTVNTELCPAAREVGDPVNDDMCAPVTASPVAEVSAELPQALTRQIRIREISSPEAALILSWLILSLRSPFL